MRINTNITALNTFNSYTSANNKISGSVAKLSSGYAINNAADNAAGLAISEKMRAQVRGLDRASANSQDAISLIQTAEGNLKSSDEILQRMREISVQSSSDVNENAIDRESLQAEFSQLQSELDEIAEDASFNNQKLLNGNLASSKTDTSVSTKASGLTATAGKANAGIYGFKVSVKTTAAEVKGEAATAGKSPVTSSTVNSYFTSASTTDVSSKQSSLLNGNYKLEGATVGEDGSITVTAKGDNGQTFTAKLNKEDYASATATDYTLKFGEGDFSVKFSKADALGANPTASAVEDLAKAFNGTELTIGGGVDAKAAEKAVYASITGAGDVKLEAGMDSVTFDNGVTVNFDKLTSANLDTSIKANGAAVTAGANYTAAGSYAVSGTPVDGTAAVKASFAYDLSGMKSSYTGSMTFTVNSKDYTIDVENGDDANKIAGKLAAKLQKSFADATSVGSTYKKDGITVDGSKITFTADAPVAGTTVGLGDIAVKEADSKLGEYAFQDVFGKAAAPDGTGVSNSEITVATKANDGLTIQVGANTGDEMEINLERADAEYLGVKGLSVGTQGGAAKAIDVVNSAINQVTSQRAYLGAMQNRLDYKIANLETSSQNLTSAESAIRDVDMAAEMTKFTNANILSQASTAMLAQANTLPQNVLSLLG